MNMPGLPQKWLFCFQWGLIGAGAIFILLAAGMSLYEVSFLKHAVHATGKVIQLDEHVTEVNGAKTLSYAPVFRFSAKGTVHTIHSGSGANPPGFSVGQDVSLVYSEDDPEHAEIDTFGQEWGLAVGFGIGGPIALLIGLLMRKMRGKTERPAGGGLDGSFRVGTRDADVLNS